MKRLKCNLILAGIVLFIMAGAAFCDQVWKFTPPADGEAAVKLVNAWMQNNLKFLYPGIPEGEEKFPTIKNIVLVKENPLSYEVNVQLTPHITPKDMNSFRSKGTQYLISISKSTGFLSYEEINTSTQLLSKYASYAKCAPTNIMLLNIIMEKSQSEMDEAFSSRAHGEHYYCLVPFLGKRYIVRMPVQPDPTKLPEWAKNKPDLIQQGVRLCMFPEAFAIQIWPENYIQSQASKDPEILIAATLYPKFIKSLEVEPDMSVVPLHLNNSGKHGYLYSQDCRMRACAAVLLQEGGKQNVRSEVFRLGTMDIIFLEAKDPDETLITCFDASSIFSTPSYGMTISRNFKSQTGKEYKSLAETVLEGDILAISMCRRFDLIRHGLEKAAEKGNKTAQEALKVISGF